MLNLCNFEDVIDSIILERGLDYYQEGRVDSLEKMTEGVYQADVIGSRHYTVDIVLSQQHDVTQTRCDCPYDLGQYCKHQVAVLYALQEQFSAETGDIAQSASPADSSMDGSDLAGEQPDLALLLQRQTKDELIAFILRSASQDSIFYRQAMFQFASFNEQSLVDHAVSLIRSTINRAVDKNFVSYRNVSQAVEGADAVLLNVWEYIDMQQFLQAVQLVLCVWGEMTDLLQYADDSAGTVGGRIDEAQSILGEIVTHVHLDNYHKQQIFRLLLLASAQDRYDDWPDSRLTLLEFCSATAFSSELQAELDEYLQKQLQQFSSEEAADAWTDEYMKEKIQLIRLQLFQKQGDEQAAVNLVQENLYLPDFREMAIGDAREQEDYQQMLNLAVDGQKTDQDYPGLVARWKKVQYEAYRGLQDIGQQRRLARQMLLDGDFDFYEKLKQTYAADEWPAVYLELLSQLENRIDYRGIYPAILCEEQEWPRLLRYIRQNQSHFFEYYELLMPEYPAEILQIFQPLIEKAAQTAGNRSQYRRVAGLIRAMYKAGGTEQARQLRAKLLQLYPRRPAFIDELSRLRF